MITHCVQVNIGKQLYKYTIVYSLNNEAMLKIDGIGVVEQIFECDFNCSKY